MKVLSGQILHPYEVKSHMPQLQTPKQRRLVAEYLAVEMSRIYIETFEQEEFFDKLGL
jgi:hypothetical protein